MQNKEYTLEVLKRIIIVVIILLSGLVILFMGKEQRGKNLQEAFNAGEVLICSDTLIITNSNWEISGNNLINYNSAGYLDIHKCSVKK